MTGSPKSKPKKVPRKPASRAVIVARRWLLIVTVMATAVYCSSAEHRATLLQMVHNPALAQQALADGWQQVKVQITALFAKKEEGPPPTPESTGSNQSQSQSKVAEKNLEKALLRI